MSRLKRKNKRKNAPPCIYCGERPGITEDHVVPLALFPDPKPPDRDLIIVPACLECNRDRLAPHQDYLRDLLICDYRCSDHPSARAVFEGSATRAFRSNRSDVARAIMASRETESVYTHAGIYLGNGHSIPVKVVRLNVILTMMIRGLYYALMSQTLRSDYSITINYPDPREPLLLRNSWEEFIKAGVQKALTLPNGVFRCLFTHAKDDPGLMAMLLVFYEGFPVYAYSRRRQELAISPP